MVSVNTGHFLLQSPCVPLHNNENQLSRLLHQPHQRIDIPTSQVAYSLHMGMESPVNRPSRMG